MFNLKSICSFFLISIFVFCQGDAYADGGQGQGKGQGRGQQAHGYGKGKPIANKQAVNSVKKLVQIGLNLVTKIRRQLSNIFLQPHFRRQHCRQE